MPSQCTDDVACPPVGDTCTSGTIYGACTNGQCLYDPIRLIAECFLPSTNSGEWKYCAKIVNKDNFHWFF